MLSRRSLNGSMTVVGDIAQSTGAWAHADWSEVLDQLPDRRPARRTELTIGYRLPEPNMRLAAKVLELAAPGLKPPTSVRQVCFGAKPTSGNAASSAASAARYADHAWARPVSGRGNDSFMQSRLEWIYPGCRGEPALSDAAMAPRTLPNSCITRVTLL